MKSDDFKGSPPPAPADSPVPVAVKGDIRLDRFLKWARVASTGGQSKVLILTGRVKVNGVLETRRGRLLRGGDLVVIDDGEYREYIVLQ